MKSTLESFIEPRNIPKKYGGELEFEFGDMPTLDPAIEAVTSWKGVNSAFPGGPMYWVNTEDQESIKAIAVGSSEQKERREEVCTVKKTIKDNDNKGSVSQDAATESALPIRAELLQVPTAAPSIITTTSGTDSPLTQEIPKEDFAIQNGELVPNSRPELETFHTAQDGLTQLSITGPVDEVVVNGTAVPHKTSTANQLDPINDDTLSKAPTQQESILEEEKEKVAELPTSPTVAGVSDSGLPSGSEKTEEKKEKRRSLLGGLKGKLTGH